jgi:hypothetical protein
MQILHRTRVAAHNITLQCRPQTADTCFVDLTVVHFECRKS